MSGMRRKEKRIEEVMVLGTDSSEDQTGLTVISF